MKRVKRITMIYQLSKEDVLYAISSWLENQDPPIYVGFGCVDILPNGTAEASALQSEDNE